MSPEECSKTPDTASGIAYHTYSFNPGNYLPYLRREAEKRNIPIVQKRVVSLDEVFEPEASTSLPRADVVVNASGLGAYGLLGVQDQAVLPHRGQTVLIRPPKPVLHSSINGYGTYIIPRPSTSDGTPGGEVILGGCYQSGNWDTSPDLELADRILHDAVKLMPALSHDGTAEGVEVLRHNVGLRPGRKGGPRLESEKVSLPTKGPLVPSSHRNVKPREATVVHMYGIGFVDLSNWFLARSLTKRYIPTAVRGTKRALAWQTKS